ncbi:uncharacterized protein LOC126663639 [Mercurialis annua]|uniref:uncharacterized protein LOC126663639 n=1 Tax=Mercurialis annua TaxID=3986 RepID=UPI00216068E6|nr:uncharacterized protein LOC126663639 [Mercurialis annua]
MFSYPKKQQPSPSENNTSSKPSFASIVAANQQSLLPPSVSESLPVDIGGFVSIKVSQSVYEHRVNSCKNSLIGRVTLTKGESPWKQIDLKSKLTGIWNLDSNWKLISLGRGFYHILLSNEETLKAIWSRGSIGLKPGILRLLPWTPGFNPEEQKSTTTQVWVRIHKLPWEFWDKQLLAEISRGIGVPLKIDHNTINGELGHFARVLVDMDLSKSIHHTLRVETADSKFWVDLVHENLFELCTTCLSIGHSSLNCRRNINQKDFNLGQSKDVKPANDKKDPEPDRGRSLTRKIWKRKQSPSDVPIRKALATIQKDIAGDLNPLEQSFLIPNKVIDKDDPANPVLDVDDPANPVLNVATPTLACTEESPSCSEFLAIANKSWADEVEEESDSEGEWKQVSTFDASPTKT